MATNKTQQAPEAKRVIEIDNYELVSKKLIDIIMHLIIELELVEYQAINKIVFEKDDPAGKFGRFDLETKVVLINLMEHFRAACDYCRDDRLSTLSFKTQLWFSLITTSIHEMVHALSFAIDPVKIIALDEEKRKQIEKEVSKETSARLCDLIRDYDVEPPDMADEPFFSALYAEFYTKYIKENSEQWAIHQNELHNTGFIWKDGDLVCNTFREWYRGAYEHEGDNKWDKEVQQLLSIEEISGKNPDDMENKKEGTLISIKEENKPVETPAETPAATAFVVPEGGIDPEMLALLDMDEPAEIDMEQAFTPEDKPTIQAAPTMPTTLPPPAATKASGLCKSCNTVLNEGAKFCFACGTSVKETAMPEIPAATPAPIQGLPSAPMPPAMGVQPQFSSGAKRPMRTNLPNHNLTAEQIRACVGEIFIRCYQHIFSKCGWSPGHNPSFAPELRNAVQEPISVVGVPCVDQVLIGMDSIDPLTGNFIWCVPAVNGMIRGKITKNLGMPSYTLYFNFNGIEAKRLIMPQNQWKVKGQGYSAPASRAQQSAMIIWLMDGDDSAVGQKWRAKIENGVLEWLI
jgi:hypothetical protein